MMAMTFLSDIDVDLTGQRWQRPVARPSIKDRHAYSSRPTVTALPTDDDACEEALGAGCQILSSGAFYFTSRY